MTRITLLAFDGCLSSTISNMLDAFSIANRWHQVLSGERKDIFELKVVSEQGQAITCSDCIQIKPHQSIAENSSADYLILPALLPVPESRLLRIPAILDFICTQHSRGTTIASVCTGAFLLAETGLLNGKSATTHWQFERKFRYRYPEVDLKIGKIITEEDNIICSGAVTAMMHLALHIIKKEGSTQLASACAKAMLIGPNRESQAPYAIDTLREKHQDDDIIEAENYMRKHIASSISMDRVASYVCLSPRHFKRRFKRATGESPLNYLQKLRIQSAKEQLEHSLLNIEEISRRVGYEDSSSFRRLFKRHTSLSPREYRDKFLLLD